MKNGEIESNEQIDEQPKNQEIDIMALKGNITANSGFDTVTIKGHGTFKVPVKYLIGASNYKDAQTGRFAVANGIGNDHKTLKFDRSGSPCTIVKTNEGHEVSLKLDTLSANLQRLSANTL